VKLFHAVLLATTAAVFAGCDQKPTSTTEQVKDKVNDALDRRSNEKLRDAAEDVRDGVKEAVKDLKK